MEKRRIDYFESLMLKDLISKPLLSQEEELDLLLKTKAGDMDARNELITHNYRLIYKVAKEFNDDFFSFMDLFDIGVMGLIHAIEKYDINSGYKLVTYAMYWIRSYMFREKCSKSLEIKIPVNVASDRNKLMNITRKLGEFLKRQPNISELIEATGLSEERIYKVLDYPAASMYLNRQTNDDNYPEFGDLIVDQSDLQEECETRYLQNKINELINSCYLKDREIYVLNRLFGFFDREPVTLEVVAQELGITRARVFEIEKNALNKIRKDPRCDELLAFANDTVYASNKLGEARIKKEKNKSGDDSGFAKKQLKLNQVLKDYSPDLIDFMLSKLRDDEMELLIKVYGDDLKGYTGIWLSMEERTRLKKTLVPKMKRILKFMQEDISNKVKIKK